MEERIYYCGCCHKVRESQKSGYCKACHAVKNKEYKQKLKDGYIPKPKTPYCPCGALKRKGDSYCQPCITRKSIEWRKVHGFTPEEIKRKNELQNKRWRDKNPIKPAVRKRGSLINGVPVKCVECDRLSEGWCDKCRNQYEYLRYKYETCSEYNLKHKVRALTRGYIKAGHLVKEPCEVCGKKTTVEAHHDDYTKPMDIRWLCKKHHDEWHDSFKFCIMHEELEELLNN